MTTQEIINIAKVSTYLAQIDVSKGSLFGRRLDTRLPRMLYMERKALEWCFDLSETDSSLPEVGNYVYALCGNYALKAAQIIATSGGGSTVNPSAVTGYTYRELSISVNGESGSPVNGETTYQNDELIGATDLSYILVDNVPETLNVDFYFNSLTGTITRNNQWFTGSNAIIPFNKKLS